MKFMVTWSINSDNLSTVAERFLAGKAVAPEGVTLLGRWTNLNANGGWSLYETDNPAALLGNNLGWADVMEIHTEPVVEDAQTGPLLMAWTKK